MPDIDRDERPSTRSALAGDLFQTLTQPPTGPARYAAVIVYRRLQPFQDPVEMINAGDLRPEEWSVVGVDQTSREVPVAFSVHRMAPGETVAKLAEKYRMPESLLRSMNGLDAGEQPAVRRPVCVMDLKPKAVAARAGAPQVYEVKPGETLDVLFTRWKVEPETFYDLNPTFSMGAEVAPGDLIYRPAEIPRPEAVPKESPSSGTFEVKSRTSVYATSDTGGTPIATFEPKRRVFILSVLNGMGRTLHLRKPAYLPLNAMVAVRNEPTSPGGGRFSPVATPPINASVAQRIRYWALALQGIPYKWGGNSVRVGVDCSHYVALVFQRAGVPPPSPPVFNQERVGRIVHVKATNAIVGRKLVALPTSTIPSGTTRLDALACGDRIIIQRDPLSMKSGSRHTGIYLGDVVVGGRRFRHGVAHASSRRGTTVAELTSPGLWSDYRYSMRSIETGLR